MKRTIRSGLVCAIAGSCAACRIIAGLSDLPDDPSVIADGGHDVSIDARVVDARVVDGTVEDGRTPIHDAGIDALVDSARDAITDAPADTLVEAGSDPCDDGSGTLSVDAGVLEDSCSDSEWRSLRSPLVILKLHDQTANQDVHLVTDVQGRCRRWLKSDTVIPSPDGRAVAWTASPTSFALAAASAVSTPQTFVNAYPRAFSPDGAWLAFSQTIDGSFSQTLHIASSPDGHELSIGANFFFDFFAWAPDSRRFTYVEGSSINFDCVDHCGAQRAWFTNTPEFPVWSPDSSRVAVQSSRDNTQGHLDVFVVDAQTAAVKKVTSGGPDESDFAPVFSRSGKEVAFAEVVTPSSGSTLFDVGAACSDGTCLHPLASAIPSNAPQWNYDWAANDTRVVFTADSHLYAMCPDGSCTTDLGRSTGYVWSQDRTLVIYGGIDPVGHDPATLAACVDGSCTHRIGPASPFWEEPYGGWHKSHDTKSIAYLGDDDHALYAFTGVASAALVSSPGETLGPTDGSIRVNFQWTFDDHRLVYVVADASGTPLSAKSTFIDGTCRATVTPSLPSTMILKDIVGTLVAPNP